MNDAMNVIVGVLVVGLVVARQVQVRRVKEDSAAKLVLILGVIGVVDTAQALHGHALGAATIGLFAVELALAAGLGAARAASTQVWRDRDGVAWRRGNWVVVGLWVVSLAAHLGLDAAVDHASGVSGLGTSSVLLYLAVTLGVQRELVRSRAARLAPVAVPDRG